jgi:AraC-like DNA-binding protein
MRTRVGSVTQARGRAAYSARFLRAFVEELSQHSEIGPISAKFVESQADERVPVEIAHQALAAAIEATHDPDLGLKAARRLTFGDAGALDYYASSAPTLGDAIEAVRHYARLINDVLDVRLELEDTLALVCLDNNFVLPRAAVDFQVGGFFRNHVCDWFPGRLSEVTVSFMHTEPADISEYRRSFAPASLRFGAARVSFSFDQRFLELPIARADPKLHDVMQPFVEHTMGTLRFVKSVTSDVAEAIGAHLAQGQPEIARVASQLAMSVRTLARRLDEEGTTFRDILNSVRRKFALDYVRQNELGVSEIAERLGFSHAAAFHRAFRRWTDQTPLQYRKRIGRRAGSERIAELAQQARKSRKR